ncbi:peptidase A24 [Bifidobacterium leontopitheci]|uniref:Peptidase A24 n=1 Tax=Bifidobacterium leontopitheci TaxID=2650774 RepID=A0A6I1GHU7_9BIFI|nr:peptidase A24 [Bifidobacterium leontopitheci]KAB7791233.1 peptidase A24 [Bifidobacterium leontopitheci]
MTYLALLPGLICGIAVGAEDLRRRRVPRLWIAAGSAAQMIAVVILALATNTMFLAVQAPAFALLCAILQTGLALARPRALGFGDVTCTFMVGLSVGLLGLEAVVAWWLAMGVLGLAWMWLWLRFDPQRDTEFAGKVPFAPAIVVSAVVVVAGCVLW